MKSPSPFVRTIAILVAAILLAASSIAGPALAQAVGDYQLPSPTGSPSSRAQGPTDPENPAATPRPATATPSASPTPAPAPVASPATAPATSPTTKAPATKSVPSSILPAVRATGVPRATAPIAPTTPAPLPTGIARPVASPDAEAAVPVTLPSAVPVPADAPAAPTASLHPAAWPWLGSGAAVLAALALALAHLRRRNRRSETHEAGDDASALPAENAVSPLLPAEQPPAAQANPLPASPVPADPAPSPDHAPPPIPAPAFPATGSLDIALDAARLSATLVNTALDYRLLLANTGATRLEALVIEADMVGAHASLPVEAQLASEGLSLPERHRIEGLAPDESRVLAGTIRLPLAEIRAIRQGSAALFIPLVRLRLFARDGERLLRLARTWVIGEGETLPGAGLRPFRLDLGPRVYPEVDQRQL